MKKLWDKDQERTFFTEAREFASFEQLFYVSDDDRYYAYWPKNYKESKTTLQARNALIGRFTEKWSANLLQDFAKDKGHHVVQGAICDEIGLPKRSSADLAICRVPNIIQSADNILLIFEIKMSVVWNWELKLVNDKEELICLGDYRTHQGTPGLLRSDSMLKAIGKSINIRVSSAKASKIPIIVLGNTPITDTYYEKVDHLKTSGIIQGFWSINSVPLDNDRENIKNTKGLGFYRFDTYEEFANKLEGLFGEEREFFSGMRTKDELGRMIEVADQADTYKKKAEKFLALIRG
ncbi:MAG: hypothetical protein JW732_04520 [Dehalococcoidia bacterium]|nr:hypothetical protein [Dehalococcoidia bacterium]